MKIKKYIWPFCIAIVLLEGLYFMGNYCNIALEKFFGESLLESTNRGLGEVYVTVAWKYDIWRQSDHIQVCNNAFRYGCLNWRIKGLKIVGNPEYKKAFVYFQLFTKADLGKDPFSERNRFKLFGESDIQLSPSEDRVPKFAVLDFSYGIDTYDDTNLKQAPSEAQEIFKELEKKPTIVINGVDYTNKKLK